MLKAIGIWIVGLLLLVLLAWLKLTFKQPFFEVANIHDLLEMASSVATVIAVILAAFSFNTWRNQIKAESDHGLARQVAVSLLKHKESIQTAYSDAQFCVNNCIVGFEGLPPDLLRSVTDSCISRMDKAMTERAELMTLLVEARALWGDELSNSLSGFVGVCEKFYACVRMFSVAIGPERTFEQQDLFKTRIIGLGEEYSADGWEEGKVLVKANELSRFADEYIKSKLLS